MMETDSEAAWRAFRRVARIKGPSSAVMGNILLTIFLLMVVSTIVLLVLIVVDAPATPAGVIAFFVCLYIWGAVGGLLIASVLLIFLQAGREARRGGYAARYVQNCVQIDPRTGVVIREAGDPPLTPEMYKARIREARAWAKANPR